MTVSLKASNDYLPALDGLRAVSILLVVISHAGLSYVVPGGLGVLIFFVISGFLITRQMIVEVERTGSLNIKAFYLRRIFRLLPALILYLVLFSIILLGLSSIITPMHLASGLFYFANYYQVFIGYPLHNPVPIAWSLAVEEHYYIVFPFLILMARKNLREILPLLGILVMAVLVWRIFLFSACHAQPELAACGLPGEDRIFHATDSIFDCILYGAIAALVLHYHSDIVRRHLIGRNILLLAGACLLITLLFRDEMFRETLRISLQCILIAVIIVNILFGEWEKPRSILAYKSMVWIGRLSYSLYLFHFGVLITVQAFQNHKQTLTEPIDFILYFILSFTFAAGSYYLVEKPMIGVRKRFGSHIRQ